MEELEGCQSPKSNPTNTAADLDSGSRRKLERAKEVQLSTYFAHTIIMNIIIDPFLTYNIDKDVVYTYGSML